MSINEATSTALVIVGVDGSEPSRQALKFAVAEAGRRHAQLRVVAAYDTANDAFLIAYGGPADLSDSRRVSVQRMADRLLAQTLGGGSNDIDVTVEVRPGSAAGVLLEESSAADLLVVGSRGHGGFRGLALGSVSQQCVQHASCPVTVVHAAPQLLHQEELHSRQPLVVESLGPLF